MGKYLSTPATKECSDESFCNCFSHSTQNGTGLGGEGSRVGGQDRGGRPCVNPEILGPTCRIHLHSWLQPHDGYTWQWAGWSGLRQSCWTIMREGLVVDLEALGSPGQSAAQCPDWWHLWQAVLGGLSWFGQFGPMFCHDRLSICFMPCHLRIQGLP